MHFEVIYESAGVALYEAGVALHEAGVALYKAGVSDKEALKMSGFPFNPSEAFLHELQDGLLVVQIALVRLVEYECAQLRISPLALPHLVHHVVGRLHSSDGEKPVLLARDEKHGFRTGQ